MHREYSPIKRSSKKVQKYLSRPLKSPLKIKRNHTYTKSELSKMTIPEIKNFIKSSIYKIPSFIRRDKSSLIEYAYSLTI